MYKPELQLTRYQKERITLINLYNDRESTGVVVVLAPDDTSPKEVLKRGNANG